MKSNQLFIPIKIRAGFQKREDTFTKKLSYIIYYGPDGKIRKETSFNSWRDKTIDTQEFDNLPQSGLILNKNIERHNWGHFSSGRSYIRVYDPRGMEFEITPENLIGILMSGDVNRRALSGEYVFAWKGKDLILLPCSSEEYQKAVDFTKLQGQTIITKDLTPGLSYKTKRDGDIIYVGKFFWYEASLYSRKGPKPRTGKKYHIFTKDDGKTFEYKSNLEFLALKNSDEIVSNYASIIEEFQKNIHSSKIIDYKIIPAQFSDKTYICSYHLNKPENDYYKSLERTIYFSKSDNRIIEYHVNLEKKWDSGENKHKIVGYSYFGYIKYNIESETLSERDSGYGSSSYYNSRVNIYQKEDLQKLDWGDLELTLESGRKIVLTGKDSLYSVMT